MDSILNLNRMITLNVLIITVWKRSLLYVKNFHLPTITIEPTITIDNLDDKINAKQNLL